MTLTCKNMNIHVSENMTTSLGQDQSNSIGANQSTTVGQNITESAGMNKTSSIGMLNMLSVGTDFITNVMRKMTGTRGICSLDNNNVWGNSYIVFSIGLQNARTIIHECGHSFSLTHIFEEAGTPKHIFYQSHTDNYMDYDWRQGGASNPYKEKMFSLFKWQWDIMLLLLYAPPKTVRFKSIK